jgi:hypothetical protein
MQPRCQSIVNAITGASGIGPTADHMKHIRKDHAVQATPHKHDARIKHYRIKPSKATAASAAKAAAEAAQPKAEAKPTLSASELEAAICDTLRLHASPRKPMDMDTLRVHLQAPATLVRPAIIALVQRETVTRIKGGYHLPEAPKQTLGQTVAGPRQVDVMHTGDYIPVELRPFDGRPGAMDAYRLPSRGMRV